MAQEIWEQTDGNIDAFLHAVGTGGSLLGTATTLREFNSKLQIVAVEPTESAVLSGDQPGSHKIEGIGAGSVPFFWDETLVNAIEKVSTLEAEEMARRLAREEAIFAGISSGANLVAALRVAAQLGPDATVATILVDNGLKYLSTNLIQQG